MALSLQAQDVEGVYHVKGNSPEGGTNYVIFPDNTFVVGYFGGMITGTWEKEGNTVAFKSRVEPKFALYGRNLSTLQDTVQIRFNVRESQGVAVGFSEMSVLPLQYVFNKNPNCFSYPYIHTQTKKITDCYVANIPYNSVAQTTVPQALHFEGLDIYNEFILINLPNEYTKSITFSARIEQDLLYFDTSANGSKKRSLESLSEEDMFYLKNYTQNSILGATLTYGDEFFPYTENPTEKDLTPFIRIDASLLGLTKVEIVEDSFFTAICDE